MPVPPCACALHLHVVGIVREVDTHLCRDLWVPNAAARPPPLPPSLTACGAGGWSECPHRVPRQHRPGTLALLTWHGVMALLAHFVVHPTLTVLAWSGCPG